MLAMIAYFISSLTFIICKKTTKLRI